MIQVKVPDRHPAAQKIVSTNESLKALEIALIGIPEYAGDRENPREVPRFTLYDYRTRYNEFLATNHELVDKTDAAYLNFYSNEFEADYRHGSIISNEILWWLLRQGDLVLLSDGDIDHYTKIAKVDYEKEHVSFMDRWPERFFLHGKNTLGITAVDNLTVTKKDFEQVVVGAISLDSTALLYSIYDTFPRLMVDLDFNLSTGIMILDLQRDELAFQAIPFLELALKLAKQKKTELEMMAASQLYYACLVAHFNNIINGFKTKGELANTLRSLESEYGSVQLQDELNDRELGRLGYVSAWAQQFDAAMEFSTRSINLNSNWEIPFFVRGKVYLALEEFDKSEQDLNKSLSLIRKRIRVLKKQLKEYDPEALDQIEYDSALISGLENRKYEMYQNLVIVYIQTDIDEAAEIAQNLSVIRPQDPFSYEMLAQIYHVKKDDEKTLKYLDKALEYENDIEKKSFMEKLKDELLEKID